MTIPTMYDPSLAPEGRHIMGIFLQYAPYTLRGTTWDEQREPYAERILDVIEEYCPNIRSIVVERQTLTPLDLERRFGITGGNIFHGEMSLDQMVRPAAGRRVGKVPDSDKKPVLMWFRRTPRRRRDGRPWTQCGPGDS